MDLLIIDNGDATLWLLVCIILVAIEGLLDKFCQCIVGEKQARRDDLTPFQHVVESAVDGIVWSTNGVCLFHIQRQVFACGAVKHQHIADGVAAFR